MSGEGIDFPFTKFVHRTMKKLCGLCTACCHSHRLPTASSLSCGLPKLLYVEQWRRQQQMLLVLSIGPILLERNLAPVRILINKRNHAAVRICG